MSLNELRSVADNNRYLFYYINNFAYYNFNTSYFKPVTTRQSYNYKYNTIYAIRYCDKDEGRLKGGGHVTRFLIDILTSCFTLLYQTYSSLEL